MFVLLEQLSNKKYYILKYISTLIILILFSFISTAQNVKINPILIIGKTIKIGNLEVAEKDFPNKMNWQSAKIACEALRNGWRLPTIVELNIMFQNKKKIGGFANLYYWSSTEVDFFNAWVQDFYDGFQGHYFKDVAVHVRAIRAF